MLTGYFKHQGAGSMGPESMYMEEQVRQLFWG